MTRFLNDESGAITIDWVVLTTALVGIGVAIAAMLTTSISSAGGGIGNGLADVEMPSDMASQLDAIKVARAGGS